MKKLLAVAFAVMALGSFVFAQEKTEVQTPAAEQKSAAEEQAAPAEAAAGGSVIGMRIGADVVCDLPVGDLADYLTVNIGGQVNYEFDFPVAPSLRLGAAVHAGGFYGLVKADELKSCFDMRFGGGIFLRVPVKKVFFQPELGYGCAVFIPKKAGDTTGDLNSVYADQYIQLGLGLRFAPVSVAKGLLEFNFTPTYTFEPENGNSINMIGARVGCLYRLK